MIKSKFNFRKNKVMKSNIGILVIVFLILITVFNVLNKNFISARNLQNILLAATLSGMVAIGQTYLIIGGQIDLSAGSVAAFSGVLSAWLLNKNVNTIIAILLTLVAVVIIGYTSSFYVNRLKIQPFIATLATMSIIRGIAYLICKGKPIYIGDPIYNAIGKIRIFGIPFPIVILLILFIIFGIILSKTEFGRNIYVIGGNKHAARLAGIDASIIITKIYILTALLSGIGGIILAARMNTGQPAAATSIEFDAITATVLGGVAMTGGEGSLLGTFMGVLILQSFNNGLILMNVSTFWQNVASGVLLVLALSLDYLRKRKN